MKLLGLLGVVACLAAAVVVWFAGSRLGQANEKVFDAIDKSLAVTRDRVLGAQKHVQESKITTDDVRQGLESWVRKEAAEQLVSRLAVEKRAEQLASGLRRADSWLELSGASLQGVQQLLETASSLGVSTDATNVDALLERLESVRSQLEQSSESVGAIRERMAEAAEGPTLGERISQVAQLAVRVWATLGEIDSHLGRFAEGLVERQTNARQLKRRAHLYIVAAQVSAVLLIAWMAAGQVCLWRQGWRRRDA